MLSQIVLVPVECVRVVCEVECFYGYIGWLSAPLSSIVSTLVRSLKAMAS